MFVKGFPGFGLPGLFPSPYASSMKCHGQRESFLVAPAIWSFTSKILTKILFKKKIERDRKEATKITYPTVLCFFFFLTELTPGNTTSKAQL